MINGIWQTFLAAMVPLTELRLAIPFGYAQFDLDIWTAVGAGILGNIFVVALILLLLPVIVKLFWQVELFRGILEKIFAKTRDKFAGKISKWGAIALILFVAVPLPGSGGWTGALVAYLFGLSYWKSMKFISIGLVIAGVLVGLLTVGVDSLIGIFV
jgi:uncharacterized membrane protein